MEGNMTLTKGNMALTKSNIALRSVWHKLLWAMVHRTTSSEDLVVLQFLAPAVAVGETEGAMDSTSFFASSFAYNFVRK